MGLFMIGGVMFADLTAPGQAYGGDGEQSLHPKQEQESKSKRAREQEQESNSKRARAREKKERQQK